MEGVGRRRPWKDLKQRLAFKGIGLCGSLWSLSVSNMNPSEDGLDPEQQEQEPIMGGGGGGGVGQIPAVLSSAPPSVGQIPAYPGINLATALAEERNQRSVGPTVTPLRSLMRLFDETDGVDGEEGNKEGGIDALCCVCIERNKGAAFIPCGHTFCRVCSRELLLNRGSCPLCNRSINEILDIF
ncbi:putative E3 ubiquitin-protein ligase XBAT35 [Cornus florida]|uniref:putative E3 ubiquitin-protein ligase XBAT35 n=1 Tax=Cornus florida TaxID=4283 RepID=UPI0028994A43|nr:putative E3 ubiquitin-protein ligase XBAT35 [Cornus florida]